MNAAREGAAVGTMVGGEGAIVDDRTPDMALLPGERAMTGAEWAEYGGLPPTLRAYCHRLLLEEAEARRLQRLDALEIVHWRDRAMRVVDRLGAAEQRAVAAEAEVARWSMSEPTAYRDCRRCKGSGAAPGNAAEVASNG